jgi:hypothetical protein
MFLFRMTFLFTFANFLASIAVPQSSADWPDFGGKHGGGQCSKIDQINDFQKQGTR